MIPHDGPPQAALHSEILRGRHCSPGVPPDGWDGFPMTNVEKGFADTEGEASDEGIDGQWPGWVDGWVDGQIKDVSGGMDG